LHLHRDGDVVGELADDAAQAPGVGELLLVVLQVQDHVGAAARLLDRLQRVAAATVDSQRTPCSLVRPARREISVTLSATM
jgi:hypothetical protein